jgi:hypothetical protein
MLQGHKKFRLKSSFRKFYGRYNDLFCNYKLSLGLAYVLNGLLHARLLGCRSILALRAGNPVYLISTKGARRV